MNQSASFIITTIFAVFTLFPAPTAPGQQFDFGNIVNGPIGQHFRQEFQQQLPQVIDQFKSQVLPPNFGPGIVIDPVPVPQPRLPYPGIGKPLPPEYIVNPMPGSPIQYPPQRICPITGQPLQPWQPYPGHGTVPVPTYPQEPPQFVESPSPARTHPQTETLVNQPASNDAADEPDAEVPQVELGSTVRIEGEDFGDQPGAVYLKINELILKTKLLDWSGTFAAAELPELPIVEATAAIIIVLKADASVGKSMDLQLLPSTKSAEAEENVEAEGPGADEEFADDAPTITGGQELTIEAELGASQGKVALRIGSMTFSTKILAWSESSVDLEIPTISTTEVQAAKLVITNSDDQEVDSIAVNYAPDEQ
jgi:hypothetical protein